jgi:hypothetical protein
MRYPDERFGRAACFSVPKQPRESKGRKHDRGHDACVDPEADELPGTAAGILRKVVQVRAIGLREFIL